MSFNTPLIFGYEKEYNSKYFVSEELIAPRIVSFNGVDITTLPLRFGERVDLLGLSHNKQLGKQGLIDFTDAIGQGLVLKTLFFKNENDDVIKISLSPRNLPEDENVFRPIPEESVRDRGLQFKLELNDPLLKESVTAYVDARMHLEMGHCTVFCQTSESSLTPLGYTLCGFRTNSNRS